MTFFGHSRVPARTPVSHHHRRATHVALAVGVVAAGLAVMPGGLAVVHASSPTGLRAGSQLYGGSNPGESGSTVSAAKSVTTVNGNLWSTVTELSVPGRGRALQLTRTYNGLAAASESAPDAMGWGWTDSYAMSITFDGSGNATVHHGNGSTIPFTVAGGIYRPGVPMASSTLVHNPDGTYTYTLADQTADTFDAAGRLVSQTDRNGYLTTLIYNSAGQLTTVTDPAGRNLSFTYNPTGQLSSVIDPRGHTVTHTYDAAGNLASVSDPMGNTVTYTYDTSHRLLTATDADGNVTTNTYDSSNRVTRQVDPLGNATTFAYGAGTTTVTRPNLGTLTESFDVDGNLSRLVQTIGGASLTTSNTYDAQDDVLNTTDANGNLWTATYGANGTMLSRTDPLGHKWSWTYTARNDVSTSTDANGNVTTYGYDANGNLAYVNRPLTPTGNYTAIIYTYGDVAHPGDVTATKDADAYTTHYTYDSYGNLTRVVDGANGITTATYNTVGWKLTSVRPNGNVAGANPLNATTTYSYDDDGALLSTTDSLGHTTSTVYDADHLVASSADADHNVTQYSHDADGQLTLVTRADGSTQATSYDADGNVLTRTDGQHNVTTYGYDLADRLASLTDPLNRVTMYTDDGVGNVLSVRDAAARTTSRTYDAANRLTTIAYVASTTTATAHFYYDANANRTSMTDGVGTTNYSYDNENHLISQGAPATTGVQYGYDLVGRLSSVSYPGAVSLSGPAGISRTYDGVGRMTSVTDWLNRTSTFVYDPDGNLTSINYSDGTTAVMTYDNADRSTSRTDTGIQGAALLSLQYSNDANGQITTANPLNTTPGVTQNDGYDAVNRLTSVQTPTSLAAPAPPAVPNDSYQYDAADRLTNVTVAGNTSTAFSYDAASQLTSTVTSTTTTPAQVVGHTTNTYDALGNRTSSTDTLGNLVSYTYDNAGRLTDYAGPPLAALNQQAGQSVTLHYSYRGDGLRASWGSSVGLLFTYDLAEGLPLITSDGINSYVTGPGGLPLEMITQAGGDFSYHADRLGSTRLITDAGGRPVVNYTYDAYGNVKASSTQLPNPFLFAGQFTDASGLQWMRARYYDSTTGQFITRDPLAAATGAAPYAYAADNPVNLTDPSGLLPR